MARMEPTPSGHEVTLTRFHNNTGEFLDLALRQRVTLTKHGRAQWHITEAGYLERLEEIARGNLLEAMDRKHVFARDLDEAARAEITNQLPTAEEISNDRWNDE